MPTNKENGTVTITELISSLETIRAERGDLPVLRFDQEWGNVEIEQIGVVGMFALRFEGIDGSVEYTSDSRQYMGRTSTPVVVVELH